MFIETLENISVIVAAISVIYGIGAWRREYVGKHQIDLAEEVLELFYEAKDLISMIRNPGSTGDEGKTRKPQEGETPEEKELRDRAYIVFERYLDNKEVFNKIHAKRYRFLARFGPEAGNPFDALRKILSEIFIAARLLPDYWLRQGKVQRTEARRQEDLKKMYELQGKFWEGSEDPDPINPKVGQIISEIESICRPIIDRKGFMETFIDWIKGKRK